MTESEILKAEQQREEREFTLRLVTRIIVGIVLVFATFATCSITETSITGCSPTARVPCK